MLAEKNVKVELLNSKLKSIKLIENAKSSKWRETGTNRFHFIFFKYFK